MRRVRASPPSPTQLKDTRWMNGNSWHQALPGISKAQVWRQLHTD